MRRMENQREALHLPTPISNTVAHASRFKPDAGLEERRERGMEWAEKSRGARGERFSGRNVFRVKRPRGNGSLGVVRSDQRLEPLSACVCVCRRSDWAVLHVRLKETQTFPDELIYCMKNAY